MPTTAFVPLLEERSYSVCLPGVMVVGWHFFPILMNVTFNFQCLISRDYLFIMTNVDGFPEIFYLNASDFILDFTAIEVVYRSR